MKKVTMLLAIFAVVLLLLVRKSISDEEIRPSNVKLPINEENQNFTLIVTSGDVLYGDGEIFTRVETEEIELPNKTFVKTDEGTADIILPNNSVITMDSFTSIQLVFTDERTTLKQLYGNTWNRIKDLASMGEYRVETDNTIAAVRGTVFSVNVDKAKNTEVHVVESLVEVTKGVKKPDQTWEVIEKELIEQGRFAKVETPRDAKMLKNEIPEAMKVSNWYTGNQALDQQMMQIESKEELKKIIRKRKDNQENNNEDRITNTDTNTTTGSDEEDSSTTQNEDENGDKNSKDNNNGKDNSSNTDTLGTSNNRDEKDKGEDNNRTEEDPPKTEEDGEETSENVIPVRGNNTPKTRD